MFRRDGTTLCSHKQQRSVSLAPNLGQNLFFQGDGCGDVPTQC